MDVSHIRSYDRRLIFSVWPTLIVLDFGTYVLTTRVGEWERAIQEVPVECI